MKENLTPFKNSKTNIIVFVLSVSVSGFWLLAQVINVYRFALVGAIFEILWLPSIVLLYALPVISLILLVKEKVNIRSLYIYSILVGLATILLIYLGVIV
jgi:hypothetical protein